MSDRLLSHTLRAITFKRADESDPVIASIVSQQRHKNHLEGTINKCLDMLKNPQSYKQIEVDSDEGHKAKVWISGCLVNIPNQTELHHTCDVMNKVLEQLNNEQTKHGIDAQRITFGFVYHGGNKVEFLLGFPDAASAKSAQSHAASTNHQLRALTRTAIFGDMGRSVN